MEEEPPLQFSLNDASTNGDASGEVKAKSIRWYQWPVLLSMDMIGASFGWRQAGSPLLFCSTRRKIGSVFHRRPVLDGRVHPEHSPDAQGF